MAESWRRRGCSLLAGRALPPRYSQAHHEGAYEVFRAFRPVEGLQPVELDQKIIHELGRLEQICSGIMREDDNRTCSSQTWAGSMRGRPFISSSYPSSTSLRLCLSHQAGNG